MAQLECFKGTLTGVQLNATGLNKEMCFPQGNLRLLTVPSAPTLSKLAEDYLSVLLQQPLHLAIKFKTLIY